MAKTNRGTLLEFLALNRNVSLLLIAIVLIGVGEQMWMRFLPKYLKALGASVFVIGLFDGIRTLLGATYAYPGGLIVDRWGHRRAFVAFTVISMLGYVLVIAVSHWAAVIGGMFLFLAWTTFSLPATFSLVAHSLPAGKHTMGIGIQSLVRRLPVLAGPIAGGLLIDRFGVIDGVKAGVGVSIVLAGGAIFLQRKIVDSARSVAAERRQLLLLVRTFHPLLRRLLFSDILIRFCERIPFAWVVIYAMDHVKVTATEFGYLVAVEVTVAMLCYIPASYLADRVGKEPFVIATFVFFTLFPATLSMAHSFRSLAAAFAIRGMKEFGEPARKALIISYSPPESCGQVVGAYYLIRDLIVAGASFLGAALWALGPRVNFWSAAGMGAVGTLAYLGTMGSRTGSNRRG